MEAGPSAHADIEDWARRALIVARRCARREGLSPDDADDCATEFVVRMLHRYEPKQLLTARTLTSAAWLYRCARNHAIDFRRARARLEQHESCALCALCTDVRTAVPAGGAACAPEPDRQFLRSDCLCRMTDAINQLSHVQRQLFLRHHLGGEPILNLAADFQRSPHAVEQTLHRARHRLRLLLEKQGWSERELLACLAPHRAPGRSAPA